MRTVSNQEEFDWLCYETTVDRTKFHVSFFRLAQYRGTEDIGTNWL